MVDLDAALGEQLLDIAVGQPEVLMPPVSLHQGGHSERN
jgi:hypothetical protein